MWHSQPLEPGWEVIYEAVGPGALQETVELLSRAGIETRVIDNPQRPLKAIGHRVRIAVPSTQAQTAADLITSEAARHEPEVEQTVKEIHAQMVGALMLLGICCLPFWILTGNPASMAAGGVIALFLLFFFAAFRRARVDDQRAQWTKWRRGKRRR